MLTSAERQRCYRKAHPERTREKSWSEQGIVCTWAQYVAILHSQDYKCVGCGRTLVATNAELTAETCVARLDHDHKTGRVRCALCTHCNAGLGHIDDNPSVLRKLIALTQVKGGY